jgi:hypothetical protein
MLKSRAVTVSFRFYFGLSLTALVMAVVAAISSESDPLMNRIVGPLSMGWKGGVGDHIAYTVLVGVAIVSGFLGVLLTAFRDADATPEAEIVGLEAVPLTRAPVGANYWPLATAFAVAIVLIGLATGNRELALAGGGLVAVAAFVWTVRSWAERATGDDRANVEAYERLVEPLRLPIVAAFLVAVLVLGISRVLLALPKDASVAVFGILGLVFLVGSAFIALRPKVERSLIVVLLFVLALLVIGGGIIAAAKGSREFEHHEGPGLERPAGQEG